MDIREQVSFRELVALGVGGTARYVITVRSAQDAQAAVAFARDRGLRRAVIASGSSVLPSDQGFDGVVLQFLGEPITPRPDRFVYFAGATIQGVGSVGGAVVDNALINGQPISSFLSTVTILTDGGERGTIPADAADFGQGRSHFQTTNGILLEVEATLPEIQPIAPLPPRSIRLFRDTTEATAHQVIAELGLAERRIGGVSLWKDDTAVAINDGDGTAEQVVELMSLVKQQARDTLGIQLHDAIHYLGF